VNGYLLDTHAWLWVQRGEIGSLSADLLHRLNDLQRQGKVYLSAISVLEIARMVASGHYDLGISVDRFVAEATEDEGFRLLPLSVRILIDSTQLPGEIHRDPADRLLAATARGHSLTLVTRDKELLAYARRGNIQAVKI
jgi:PIN domain nuclease of toxin-antitoxin system